MKSLVSVVMPAYNSSTYIKQSINSVLQQSFKDWELLVIDGGSTDETLSIINEFAAIDTRIRLIHNLNDCGPAHARARGIKHAKGKYIAFLDADDLWLPEKLSLQIEFMYKNNYLFSYTSYRKMDATGLLATCPLSTHKSFNFYSGLSRRGIGSPTVVIRRDLFDSNILDTVGKSHGEETLWWLLILKKGIKAYGLIKPLALYRDTPYSLSKKVMRNQATVWHSYRNELNVPHLLTLLAYFSYLVDVFIRRLKLRVCTAIKGKILVATLMGGHAVRIQ
jgi:teichuronic acid biosynthesis glycosyltransferase TuaG